MLAQVLGVTGDTLNEETLKGLVARREREWQRLEFKSELPALTDGDRREFAKDLVGMANGGGGIVIYGVKTDEEDSAAELVPVPLAGAVERLQQVALTRIEPPLRLEAHEVGSGRGHIVLEIRPSPRFPHAAREGDRLGFYMRSQRIIVPLSENQVAEAYRARWESQQQRRRIVEELRADMAQRLPDTSSLWVAIVPLETSGPQFRIDNRFKGQLRELARGYSPAPRGWQQDPLIGSDQWIGFRRVYAASSRERLSEGRWLRLDDTGAFLGVWPARRDGFGEDVFAPFSTVMRYCELVVAYRELARTIGVVGQLAVVSGLRIPAVATLKLGSFDDPAPIRPQKEDIHVETAMDTDDLCDACALMMHVKDTVELLLGLFGIPAELPFVAPSGAFAIRHIPEGLRADVRRWAKEQNLTLLEET